MIKSGTKFYNQNDDEFVAMQNGSLFSSKKGCLKMIKEFSTLHYWGWATPEDEKRFFAGAKPIRVEVIEI